MTETLISLTRCCLFVSIKERVGSKVIDQEPSRVVKIGKLRARSNKAASSTVVELLWPEATALSRRALKIARMRRDTIFFSIAR